MNLDPSAVPSALVNRALAREAWARERLGAHAGRVFAVTVGPATAGFRIRTDGVLENAPLADAVPDLRLRVSPLGLPSLLADPRRWSEYVTEEGDAELGATLRDLARTIPWFVEQAFAKALGPIAGQQVADAGRRMLAFPGYAADRVAASVVRYAHDEAALFARGDEVRTFAEQTADLAARADALAARIDALIRRASGVRAV
jgi:ubiquinone biosynthesis protein UbiJ